MNNEHWGYEATFDLEGCNKSQISDEKVLASYLAETVRRIDMIAYGEPIMKNFANHDPSKGGYTIVQLIETSSITGHFVDSTGKAFINIFSCKEFDPDDALDVIHEYFKPSSVVVKMMTRG